MKLQKFFRKVVGPSAIVALTIFGISAHQLLSAQCRQETKHHGRLEEPDYSKDEKGQCAIPLTPAEAYALSEIQAGRSVKLDDRSKFRELRGCFIKKLLINPEWKIPLHGVSIDNAVILGPIDIRSAEIPFHVELTWCTFSDDLNMMRAHFSKGFSLAGSSFGAVSCPPDTDANTHFRPGRLDARFAKIEPDFVLNDCTFNNTNTFFNGISVGQDWTLRRANFAKVDFTGARIGGDFYADKENKSDPSTHFRGDADFEYVQVKQDAGLNDVIFDGFVTFSGAEFMSLGIRESIFNGNASFIGTKINNFYLGKPKFNQQLTIEDTSFQYMAPEDWGALEVFAVKSNMDTEAETYNAQLYTNLEELFRRHGHSDDADAIYISAKRRERAEMQIFGQGGSYANLLWKPWSFVKDKFVGYGRHQEYLLSWGLAFLFIGNFVFRRETGMRTKKRAEANLYAQRYSGFWYTLDLFLPIIGLGEAEVWTPKDDRRWAIMYKRIHIIAGALIIPIGLAAWTGIIK